MAAMDRPEPGLIRWSPNANYDSFLHLNLQHRVVQLYEATGHAQRGRFDYRKISKHDEVPLLTTYDWSPSIPGLVAVGTSNGIVNLLRVDDNSNAYQELVPKVARSCLAVAFSTTGLLAAGLERVRNDPCLNVWDVNRLSTINETGSNSGFATGIEPEGDLYRRLEHNASISSIKFFEDNPQTLVVGLRGSGLRIHDLREGGDSAINFQTKCNNNLCIDYADQNYFASSALDSPGVMVWDRRALNRSVASPSYLDAIDMDNTPLGGALRLDRAMDMERDPQAMIARNSFIRKLAYCRDQKGLLAVLSRTGQLKVFFTELSDNDPVDAESNSPHLLHVRRSHEMDNFYLEAERNNERIVSFDWLTMPSPSLRPRLLVLRRSGAFEILEVPSATVAYSFKLIPWQAPYRDLTGPCSTDATFSWICADIPAECSSYHSIMKFERSQTVETLGPLLKENALSDIPIFGPDKIDMSAITDLSMDSYISQYDSLVDEVTSDGVFSKAFDEATTVAGKMKALRAYSWGISHPDVVDQDNFRNTPAAIVDVLIRLQGDGLEGPSEHSSRSLHEALLMSTMETVGFPKPAQVVLDHVMLLRAKENYLFDCSVNQAIVDDDAWLKCAWDWIENAEEACIDGGMLAHPLDLSYFGAHTIWTEDLGRQAKLRIAEGSGAPDRATWSRCLSAICKRRGIPKFDGVETRKPHHRRLLLDMCRWGAAAPVQGVGGEADSENKAVTWYTRMTALALFKGHLQEAIYYSKEGSKTHTELLFASLALQLVGRGNRHEASAQLDFDEVVAANSDPYLRAISVFIATGDWALIASQRSLPLRDRTFVAVQNLGDDHLTHWLTAEVQEAIDEGDIEGLVLTGITERTVDILATYITKFQDVQTATLIMSFCAPRYIDDYRCTAWRNAYGAYLQRHKAFYQRAKFGVESTKRSKRDVSGRPTVKPPARQIALRCIYCDAEASILHTASSSMSFAGVGSSSHIAGPLHAHQPHHSNGRGSYKHNSSSSHSEKIATPETACPNCKRHLPRCVVCLEAVGTPRSDAPGDLPETVSLALRFPTFCLRCEHVLHLDHARQWFARHIECPVPECRCRCNFRANPELNYH